LSIGERFVRSVELVEPGLGCYDLLVCTTYRGIHGPLKTLKPLNAGCVIDIAHRLARLLLADIYQTSDASAIPGSDHQG
jgi:hypothetical protein